MEWHELAKRRERRPGSETESEAGTFADSFADSLADDATLKRMDRSNVAPVPRKSAHTSPTANPSKSKSGSKRGETSPSIVRATKSQLRDLRAGKIRPQETIDLHGFRSDAAYRRLCNATARAVSNGKTCVLVIHGKGRRSEGGRAVLRDALDDWLQRKPLVEQVIGSARAQPRDGGSGATLLLLRRPSR